MVNFGTVITADKFTITTADITIIIVFLLTFFVNNLRLKENKNAHTKSRGEPVPYIITVK
jgi:hypothetical protein